MVFTKYGNGGPLGRVTKTNFVELCSLFPRMLHIKKMTLTSQAVSKNEILENNGHIHVSSLLQGQTATPPKVKIFHKHKYSVNLVISCKFTP